MRHELKYIINQADYFVLRSRLSVLFQKDSHASAHGEYRVRSLYFDDPYDSALLEKINGVDYREKFRIRMYNEDCSFIRLEKKIKSGGLGAKLSAALTRQQADSIFEGDTGWMRESGNALLVELYAKMQGNLLRPKTIVEYIREPFVFAPGSVRITLDREIRTGIYNLDFFGKPPLLHTNEAFAIVEVKYDRYLPEIVSMAIRMAGRSTTAFSKYAVCRKFD
jgi:VTC domain.